jgi:hypothetical protein
VVAGQVRQLLRGAHLQGAGELPPATQLVTPLAEQARACGATAAARSCGGSPTWLTIATPSSISATSSPSRASASHVKVLAWPAADRS